MSFFTKYAITGYLEEQPDTTHVVSMWHIPGGYDYSNATLIYLFYPSEEHAQEFAKKWDAPPEMPIVTTLDEHRKIQLSVAEHKERIRLDMEEADYVAQAHRITDQAWEKEEMRLQYAERY